MWGAIIGDLAGSIYEFGQINEIKSITTNELIPDKAFFSDDTILTIAIAKAIQTDKNYEKHLKKYGKLYENYKPNHKPYFKTSFSPRFIEWCNSNKVGTSIGNGAMMRISPVGFLFNNEEDVKENARLATIPSHNNEKAIKSAIVVSSVIYIARTGMEKEKIRELIGPIWESIEFDGQIITFILR